MIIELSIIGVCILILLTILVTLIYLGYFSHVEVNSGSSPIPFANKTFAYKSFKDNYSGVGYQFTILHNLTAVQPTELRNKLSDGIAVGIYYDNPEQVKDECKFTVGLLLNGESDCDEVRELLKKENYEFSNFPNTDNVVYTRFPNKGSVSIPLAIRSCYPKLNHFIKERELFAYPSIEMYTKDYIYFILPIENQLEFVFGKNQEIDQESSDDDVIENKESSNEDNKSPSTSLHLRKKVKELTRSSSGSSFDELNLEEESDKNV